MIPLILDKSTFSSFAAHPSFEKITYSDVVVLMNDNFWVSTPSYHEFTCSHELLQNQPGQYQYKLIITKSSYDVPMNEIVAGSDFSYMNSVFLVQQEKITGEYIQHLELYRDYTPNRHEWSIYDVTICSYLHSVEEVFLFEEQLTASRVTIKRSTKYNLLKSIDPGQLIDYRAIYSSLESKPMIDSLLSFDVENCESDFSKLENIFPLIPYTCLFEGKHKCNFSTVSGSQSESFVFQVFQLKSDDRHVDFINTMEYDGIYEWSASRCIYEGESLVTWKINQALTKAISDW